MVIEDSGQKVYARSISYHLANRKVSVKTYIQGVLVYSTTGTKVFLGTKNQAWAESFLTQVLVNSIADGIE